MLKQASKRLAGRKILLELGPGRSPVAVYYKKQYEKVLLDLSPRPKAKLYRWTRPEERHDLDVSKRFIRGNMQKIPFKDETVDRVECRMALPSYSTKKVPQSIFYGKKLNSAAKEIKRVLKPKGIVSISIRADEAEGVIDAFQLAGFSVKKKVQITPGTELARRATPIEELHILPPRGAVYIKFQKEKRK